MVFSALAAWCCGRGKGHGKILITPVSRRRCLFGFPAPPLEKAVRAWRENPSVLLQEDAVFPHQIMHRASIARLQEKT
ncbi:MAG: hypothetical protein ACK5JR_01575 [Tropicimonas sp.]|uniref:hypothetical protein n=1 Tax=Tropicimonas sp. TaxID=2067044 RepID=UPI003A84D57E